MKKFLSLVLSSALLISAMAGCGPSNADGSGSAASVESAVSSVSGGAEESAGAGEKSALTIGLRPNPLTTDYEDNYLTDLMEETTGVSLEFFFFPSEGAEAKQKFSMMVAGGETLPDIVVLPGLSDVERYNYGSGGYFIPLDEYMENDAVNWN